MAEHEVLQPVWVLTYQGTDVTRDLAPMVTEVTYTDHKHGQSDELAVTVEDIDGRWRGGWYPTKGDLIELRLGYLNHPLLPCGQFRVDEVELSGPPDTMAIRAMAAAITKDLRTKKNRALEGKTFSQIAGEIAGDHGLSVVGDIEDFLINRITQANESDLEFMQRVAEENGYAFNVREGTLTFHKLETIDATPAAVALARGDLTSYRLTDKTRQVYRACEVSYQDPETKQTITHTVEAPGIESGDVMKKKVRVESAADAERKAKAMLGRANGLKTTGSLSVPGDPRLCAGVTVTLTGMGVLSGDYQVETSTHRLQRGGGYTTEVEVKRV